MDYRKPKAKRENTTPAPTPQEKKMPVKRQELGDDVSEDAKVIYKALNEEPMHIDDIVRVTGMKMNIVLSSLTELELIGAVEQVTGKKYKLS